MPKLLLYFLLTQSFAFGQASLSLSYQRCQSNSEATLKSFDLYKKDSLIKRFNAEDIPINIDSLETGTYHLFVTYIDNKKKKMKMKIYEDRTFYFTFCFDQLDYSKVSFTPLIEQINNNESYMIHYTTVGCFHSNSDSIIVSKNNDILYINYHDLIRKITINETIAIHNFEIELSLNSPTCFSTTVNYYSIISQSDSNSYIDYGCDWKGFYNLKKQLRLPK